MSRSQSALAAIAPQRLWNQRLVASRHRRSADVVSWFGAVQAQDYPSAKWALALRISNETTDAAIERALDEGRIVRTHVLRPTWHFVAAADVRWMLELTAPRVHKALAWGHRQLGLDSGLRVRAAQTIERALGEHDCLTRPQLGEHLARALMPSKGVRLALLVMHAELEGIVCSGPRRGLQSTYALLDRRVPKRQPLTRDEALGELTTRYFQSHGPATIRDFVWWSGLTSAEAKRGLDIIRARSEAIDGLTYWSASRSRVDPLPSPLAHLLPVYDEYLVAYRDLIAVPRGKAFWGVLPQAIAIDGHVAGTWKTIRTRDRVDVDLTIGRKLTGKERTALDEAVERHRGFVARRQ